ncbi:MAG TPA: AsmA-like C-terminal region-containing protein [Prolixibacteraceae bacterium]|nr:AsmA-like C-terminal region-containing protein [Prolixibacteraceae bacterium]
MKKKIIIILGVIVLIIGILALIPFLYKDKLLVKVKATINKQVNAKVDFKDFNVSLFSHFPKVGMELEQLTVVGINQFASDTMMYAKSISTSISLSELIKGENLELKTLTIDQPRINLLVDKEGKANWDIAKETGAPSAEPAADQSFKMKLNDIKVNNLNLYYGDASMPMKMWVKNTNVNSTGEVEGTLTTFDLKGDVGEVIFEYDSVKYISNTKLKAETLLKADYDKMSFTFDRGKLMINNLPLQVNGNFSMPNDSMLFDIAFQSEKSDFATILALVPADYQKYLEKATINGAAEFKGSVKGLFYNEIYPAIDVLLNVSNGSFKYQALPESVQDIQVSARINKPEGDMNTMVVNVDKAHASIKNNPIDMTLNLSEMVTDPNIAATFAGTIDFNTLKQAIPVDSLDLTGIMKARMQIAGRMSSIEKQEYEKFKSDGEATIQNFKIVSNKLTKPVEISQAQVNATTNQITVGKFDGKVGQSDFALTGNVSNYLPYVFKNGVLKGNFNLKSSFMNFTELSNLMKEEKPDTTKAVKAAKPAPAAPADSATAFEVPDKLDLSFQSNIQKAVYDKMPINNINGAIKVKDRRMELNNLAMDMLQGRVVMTGLYASKVKNKPTFDFKVNMQNMDMPAAYQSLETFQRYVPLAAHSQGKFSTQFGLSGAMNEKMDIVPTSLNGEGLINTLNLMIIESPIFNQIRGVIKKDKLKDVKIKDFTAKFKFENGALTLNPFQTTIADQEATIGGTLSADRQINMTMDFKVNREDLGGDINKGLGLLPGSDNIKMVDASVILKGALTKPEVSLDLTKARAQIEQEVKKATKDQIKESTKKIGDELKKLFK